MATNKDFRVKNGLYVGEDINALRGSVSALSFYGKLFDISTSGTGGTGSTDALSGQNTLNFQATSGVNVAVTNNNLQFSLNVDSDDFYFDSGTLKLNTTGTADFGTVTVGGGFGSTGITLTDTGNISADGDLYISGESILAGGLSASTLSGNGSALTSNFILSAGGDVDDVTTTISALNGTYSLNLELTNTGVVSGTYGSQSEIPVITVDVDGRLTTVTTSTVATTLSTEAGTGTGTVDLLTEKLLISGTSNQITTVASNCSITVGLANNVTIPNNLTVTGDLTVNGSTVTQNVATVLIEDPLIKLANGNTSSDLVDIGFYGEYYNGSAMRYTGLMRDTTFTGTNPFVFFDGLTSDLLSDNDSGSSTPSVGEYADVYLGRLGINTSDYNASNRLTVSGAISGDNNLTIDGTVKFTGLSTGVDNTVLLINSSNELITDEIDPRVWGSSLIDGSGTANRLSKFSDADTIGDSTLSDDGTTITIGVGLTNPLVIEPTSTSTSVKFANDTSGYHSTCTTITQSSSGVILSFPYADYRSGKVVVQSTVNSAQYEVAEILFVHDNSDTYQTEYGSITTGSAFCVSYTSRINSTNVEVIASNACSGGSAVVIGSITQLSNV